MNLHLIKTATGYAIVDRSDGPYSHSTPNEAPVMELTQAQIDALVADYKALPHTAPPVGA